MSALELRRHWMLIGAGETTACTTYEVWDTDNRLAYVGIADRFLRRWEQHVRSSWWLGEINVARVVVTGWPSRLAARFSEAAAINEQAPVYNTARELASYRLSQIEDWPLPVERSIYTPREVVQ